MAASLTEAEQKLAEQPFDLVLQYVVLDDGDGIEFLPRIRALQPNVPVVILTGLGYEENLFQEAVHNGATSYMSKFLPLDQVLMEVRSVLKRAKGTPDESAEGKRLWFWKY